MYINKDAELNMLRQALRSLGSTMDSIKIATGVKPGSFPPEEVRTSTKYAEAKAAYAVLWKKYQAACAEYVKARKQHRAMGAE